SEPCVCDATRSPRLERAVAQPESSSRAGIDALLEPLRGPAQRRIEIRVSAHVRRRAGLLELLYAGFGGQEHSDPNEALVEPEPEGFERLLKRRIEARRPISIVDEQAVFLAVEAGDRLED